jgi:hypothetical protein
MFLISLGNVLSNSLGYFIKANESRCTLWINFCSLVNFALSRLGSVMCLGATAGAYILTLFAVGVSSKRVFYILLIRENFY